MNVITRGIRSAFRSPLRSGAIIAMLAISIGLILAMLAARASVNAKIEEVKATTATQITINPAGIRGIMGGGNPLTADQVEQIADTEHVTGTTTTLTDQLDSDSTDLESSLEMGSFGKRFIQHDGTGPSVEVSEGQPQAQAMTPRITLTGTTSPTTTISADKLVSGEMIDGTSTELSAIVGKKLAEKNSLSVGDTFTAYGKTITVKGIYSTDNMFEDSGIIMPLGTVQNITDQEGAASSVIATVDNSDNVSSVVTALKNKLGDKADVTSQEEQAKESLKPLEGIAGLALGGVIAAAAAGAVIVLLTMVTIVRERRREIGVIKAIGGTNLKVMTQFIVEGVTLTLVGGIIGIVLGIAVSGPMTQSLVAGSSEPDTPTVKTGAGPGKMMIGGPVSRQLQANITNVSSTLPPQTFALSAGITLLIAIIGSALPAWAIARIRPAEVLRTE